MITRYALFEGQVAEGKASAFRQAVLDELVPTWQAFPGISAVRVSFRLQADDGAPGYPMVLAVDYPDRDALETALASQQRISSRTTTNRVLAEFFTGRIHHHVTETHEFPNS
jgi:hypothetical protein